MPYNNNTAFKPVRRVRTEFSSPVAAPPRRRRVDRDPSLQFGVYESRQHQGVEARLALYFAAVLVCTALGVGLEEMRMAGAAWSLFIVGAAFLLAAVRTLFVTPRAAKKRR